jgi:hypothetical protein
MNKVNVQTFFLSIVLDVNIDYDDSSSPPNIIYGLLAWLCGKYTDVTHDSVPVVYLISYCLLVNLTVVVQVIYS